MRKMKLISALLMLALVCGLAACAKDGIQTRTKYFFSVNRTETVMETGETFEYVAVYGNEKVVFSSADETVATVDENGKITAVGAGETFVTAKADGEEISCKITVTSPIYELLLNKSGSLTVAKGAAIEIIATLYKDGAETETAIVWSVTNQSNGSLAENGNRAVFSSETAGEYEITATCDKASATVAVTIISEEE